MKQFDFRFFGIVFSLFVVLYLAIVFKTKFETFNKRYFHITQKLYHIQNDWNQHIHLIKDAIITLHYNNDLLSKHLKNETEFLDELLKNKALFEDYPTLYSALQKLKVEQDKMINITYKFIQINSKVKNSLLILNRKLLSKELQDDKKYFQKLTNSVVYYLNKKNNFSAQITSLEKIDHSYFKDKKLDYIHLSLLKNSIPQLHSLYFEIKNASIFNMIQTNFDLLEKESSLLEEKIKKLFYTIMAAYIFFFIVIVLLVRDLKKQAIQIIEKDKLLYNQAKHAAMGEMIDAIAHQWKQPLNLIHLNTDFLTYTIKDNVVPEKEIKTFQEKVFIQIKHMNDTLEQFRSFLRPNKEFIKFNVKQAIEDVLTLTKDDLIQYTIRVELIVHNDININGVPNEFKHVILNLISNSKDAFVENDIKNRKITITLEQSKETKYIYIQDNAGGIPDHIIDHIFEPNITSKEEGKGTGIGLYMTQQILDQLGATIEVKNQHQGCCFTIKIKENAIV